MSDRTTQAPNPFLPDLCRLPVVLGVLLVTELVIIIYVLSLGQLARFDWELLSLLSLYAQWISLLSTVGLCHLRPIINRLPLTAAGLLCFLWILLSALIANTGAQWVMGGTSWLQWQLSWLIRDLMIVSVLAGIGLRYMYVLQSWRIEQKATQNARVDALHARIRPHFLFNSMNTIASLISYAPEDAEKAVEDLASLFRVSLSHSNALVPWAQELDVCHAYLRIEQQRLGDRLRVDWQCDDMPNGFTLPPLTLQPLIENAIYHGIESNPAGGLLQISSEKRGTMLHINVSNPLIAEHDSAHGRVVLADQGAKTNTHNGIALDNIRARLDAIYKDADPLGVCAALELGVKEHAFVATLIIPCDEQGSRNSGGEQPEGSR